MSTSTDVSDVLHVSTTGPSVVISVVEDSQGNWIDRIESNGDSSPKSLLRRDCLESKDDPTTKVVVETWNGQLPKTSSFPISIAAGKCTTSYWKVLFPDVLPDSDCEEIFSKPIRTEQAPDPLYFIVYFDIKETGVKEFIELLKEEGELVHELEKGSIRFDLLQSMNDPTKFVVLEVVEDWKAIREHKSFPHYQKVRSAMENLQARPRSHDQGYRLVDAISTLAGQSATDVQETILGNGDDGSKDHETITKVSLLENVLSEDEAQVYLDEFVNELPWKVEVDDFGEQSRPTCYYGDPGCIFSYVGLTLRPLPWTHSLQYLRERVAKACGLSSDQITACLINYYKSNEGFIPWHYDEVRAHGESKVVASLSLGGPRKFLLRPRGDGSHGQDKVTTVLLQSGSILLMQGRAQELYEHCIPLDADNAPIRISLTFRSIAPGFEENMSQARDACCTMPQQTTLDRPILVCDAGYGLPREGRPRKEKILAIARQLANFLKWQEPHDGRYPLSEVRVVACPDDKTLDSLKQRLLQILESKELPGNVTFSCESLEEACGSLSPSDSAEDDSVVYLSPDAPKLDPTNRAPKKVVVGLLIDRRVQPNRSKDRASKLALVARRWPLEDCFRSESISATEPLNVDCVLEGMQQWWWNEAEISDSVQDDVEGNVGEERKKAFAKAAQQAIHHHAERHPSRPVHKTN